MTGDKFDQEKLRYDLIPPVVDKALASILTHGSEKYGDNNWMSGIKYRRVYAALQRHLAAWRSGKWIDDDSGYPHLWCALAELSFLIHYENDTGKYNKFNDFLDEWVDTMKRPPSCRWVVFGTLTNVVRKVDSEWSLDLSQAAIFSTKEEAETHVKCFSSEEVITYEDAKQRMEN